ncbi:MAG: hypothetical protein LW715_08540 [Rhodobacter sp.]|nr:hypothetical protein [Rhodobacter sp.]
MNLLASSIKSATYDELLSLASFVAGAQIVKLLDNPDMKETVRYSVLSEQELLERIHNWATWELETEVKRK